MMSETRKSPFSIPPLDPEDQRIADAFARVGRSVDDLPYTEHFDELVGLLGEPLTDESRHRAFKHLLSLRKRGRLPEADRGSIPFLDTPQPALDSGDRRLVEAYATIGRTTDDLPYTEDFDRLVALLGRPATDDARHHLYRRLVGLRKRGQLPRIYQSGIVFSP